ncbi:SDR family NAD(P)-dependent oxidoreductase [Amycolatopsis saalfeldensis]|uniref:NAD(P)-dependent dehydrogenase, short-chain alcohol dehydrogenase family n=1 Tax=Amycolatopsis saalfeldensis TaxID=394193 RepID=A0A1H8U2U4_9PSEU|nr:SDR family NAD(P)-dependent oxidoreductase [Amycolatopsis saalfeldensis]SEO97455.1 NAD(P)-dependent dehydrogenase, short-chain alcohol dehydrogenase family [Amycolatopsis saalfeldensis]
MKLIHTPFVFAATAAEAAAGIDLTGRRAVATGAEVTPAVRDVEAGERAAEDITATTGSTALRVARLDLTEPASLTAFTAAWDGPLHVLVANAGVMACPEQHTEQGWEWQFATNHLDHFALATGLHAALAADGAARFVMVSSSGHQLSPVVFDDVHFAFRPYDPWLAYGQSKTANALMPGAIRTNLQRHTGGRGSGAVPPELIKTPEQGAATSVVLATSPLLDGVGGRYFADSNETGTIDRRGAAPPLHGVARYALDPDNARRLWTVSERLLATAGGRS